MAEIRNRSGMTNGEALINAGFRKRIKDENADIYKMFSILYGLIIFIGGVAFSISHAIVLGKEGEMIKQSTEIYFTCLYWISIIWMIFCMIDIIRHQNKMKIPIDANTKRDKLLSRSAEAIRQTSIQMELFDDLKEEQSDETENERSDIKDDHSTKSNGSDDATHRPSSIKPPIDVMQEVGIRDSLTRRRALDSTEKHHLRSYIRHRKSSIVQHVIGYNYDDNSTAGGLYTRAGIGIFCLGTIIHSSLAILSNLENHRCVRWTAVMDDLSRLFFSLIQFFFIFKHSNLIIRAHESLARLSVIHIVITNLCVWFRMVVIETKSEIAELNAHQMSLVQHVNNKTRNVGHHLLIFDSKCSELISNGFPVTTFIHESYMRLKPLLYPCTIEFSLMSLTLFFLIWENIGKTFAHQISDKASTKNIFLLNCHASIKGLFAGMIVFSCTIVSIIVYVFFRSKIEETNHSRSHGNLPNVTRISQRKQSIAKMPEEIHYSIAILEFLNLFLLMLSLFATIWSLIKIKKLNYRRTSTRFDDVLIIISLTGTYLYSIFSTFAIISRRSLLTWIAYLKLTIIILEFVEGTFQALFIMIALRKRMKRTNRYEYPAREMITLLIILDLSLWFEETTTTTKHEANPFQLDFYHVIPWSIIAAIATPLQIFFRFHASVCLSHVWANMYHSPPYQRTNH